MKSTMTGIAVPSNPRILAPGAPGNTKTCATCKHYAITPTQVVQEEGPEKGNPIFICIKIPPVVQAFPRRIQDGTIIGIDRITSYPQPAPFHSCDAHAVKLVVANEGMLR